MVFKAVGMPYIIDKVIEGYDATALAYGLTGSGKTYTITGNLCKRNKLQESNGLIQLSLRHLFEKIQKLKPETIDVSITYSQIYQERVYDLLRGSEGIKNPLKIRSTYDGGFKLENITVEEVDSLESSLSVLEKGSKQIIISENLLNLQSSRSHSLFSITLQRKSNNNFLDIVTSQLQFVDLAGSERFAYFKDSSKTHIKEWYCHY